MTSRSGFGILVPALLLTMGAPAQAESVGPYQVVLHLENLTAQQTLGCDTSPRVRDENLTCEMINVNGVAHPGATQVAWVLVGGIPDPNPDAAVAGGLSRLEFGIQYDYSVDVRSWTLCTGGLELAQADGAGAWPQAGTGNAVDWEGCYLGVNPDGLTPVGFFTIGPGSSGVIRIVPDPRVGDVRALDCGGNGFTFCDRALGGAVVDEATDGSCAFVLGDDACGTCGQGCADTPVEESTWSDIKKLYR